MTQITQAITNKTVVKLDGSLEINEMKTYFFINKCSKTFWNMLEK
jgi:hypothetical protein